MAGPPRPTSGQGHKKSAMKPPTSRQPSSRAISTISSLHSRNQNGAASPAENQLSMSINNSHLRSPPKTSGGIKRKDREYDAEGTEETNIHVVVRCRGRSDREVRENSGVVLQTDGVKGQSVELSMGPSALSNKTYRFDKVFSPAADQSMIYDEVVTPFLDEMVAGYNCTIFAYGQTGTGKTYTMSGDMSDTLGLISDSAGIIPRVLNSLFRKLDADGGESSVKCSFIELYNEELRDLLSPDDGTKLKIYEDGQKKGHAVTLVQGMEESHIKTAADGINLLQNGSHKRQVAATKCNELSSRSHTVFTVTAYIKRTTDVGEDFVSAGKLNLVDLAGSENIQRSGAENKRAAEAGLINKSLLTLGRVINALVERGSHIPYRESKLTRLLQDSLGGRTKTCIIATVSPAKSNLEETISTLDYAFRAKNIKNKPHVNSMISKKTLLREFTAEIEKLKSELTATRHRNGVYLTAEGYDEIIEQSESRRILCDEQRERIEAIEVSLRNKVQELFNLTNTFTTLRKDYEGGKQALEETKDVLDKTEIVLADARQCLADEKLLRHAHQATEAQLVSVGRDLQSSLDHVIADTEGLHAKIKRKSDLQDVNRQEWDLSQNQVLRTTSLVESRIQDFAQNQDFLITGMSNRMRTFVKTEVERLGSTQQTLSSKTTSFESSEKEVLKQTSEARDEMNQVLEEIKVLREEVKGKVAEGLNGLSAAAGRISAEVIGELGVFQNQLHTSYSSLGKEFKGIFDDLNSHLQAQKAEADNLRQKMSASTNQALRSNEAVCANVKTHLQQEGEKTAEENQALLSQISELIRKNGEEQERRRTAKFFDIQQKLHDSRSNLTAADKAFNLEMSELSTKQNKYVESVSKSRDFIKSKMKEDWKVINERNNSIQNTTKSVHEETIRIVDAQMADVSTQMQALDEFVARARSHNEGHYENHVNSLSTLTSDVQETYSSIGRHLIKSHDHVREVGLDISNQSTIVRAALTQLPVTVQQPLKDLNKDIADTRLQEYTSTGETPQRRLYQYSTILPRTEPHDKLLGRKANHTHSPLKSPNKALIYTDVIISESQIAPPSPSKEHGLREISSNVGAALQRNNSDPTGSNIAGKLEVDAAGMGPPPLKRQATESKLPTKLGGGKGGVVRLEGRENLGASFGSSGRRLRSSPSD